MKTKPITDDAILEIGMEEIPARFIKNTLNQLKTAAEEQLSSNALGYKNICTYATPRRLVLYIESLAGKQETRTEEIIGPPVNRAYDNQGNPTQAATGFAKSHGVKPETLTQKSTGKGDYLCFCKQITGKPTEELLPEIFVRIIYALNFPNNMAWEESGIRFARPIRNIMAIYGSKLIKFTFAGIRSGKYSFASLADNNKRLEILNPQKYVTVLKNVCILVDLDERQQTIVKSLHQIAKRADGLIDEDKSLIEEVNCMVEYPTAVLGKFPEHYLMLPPEIIVNCLKKKQFFFPISEKSNPAKLKPCFIGIRNGISENQDIVREGYERVLKARLADAEFFYHQDARTKLTEKAEMLKKVVFQEQLGTISDKMVRVAILSEYLYEQVCSNRSTQQLNNIKNIVHLCKSDLVTELVGEYPELQGVIGRIYALNNGEEKVVADGIEQHYWPLASDGKLPETIESAVVSIADKIDTLAGDFAIGLIPTGSADPYGLRKQAMGVIRILKENNWNISLNLIIEKSLYLISINFDKEKTAVALLEFLRGRLETLLTDTGYRYDEINAVLSTGYNNIPDTFLRIESLKSIRQLPDHVPLSILFKRIVNIIRQAKEKQIMPDNTELNQELLQEDAEKLLWQKFSNLNQETEPELKNKQYLSALQKMVTLRPEIDTFFEKVMVMDKDNNLRNNRLILLSNIAGFFYQVADLSCLAPSNT